MNLKDTNKFVFGCFVVGVAVLMAMHEYLVYTVDLRQCVVDRDVYFHGMQTEAQRSMHIEKKLWYLIRELRNIAKHDSQSIVSERHETDAVGQ